MKLYKIIGRALLVPVLLCSLSSLAMAQSFEFIEGLKFYQQKDFAKAKDLLLKETEQNPKNDAAFYYLASIAANDPGQAELSEEYLKKALELSPENFWYKYDLAIIYGSTDRTELSVMLMEELIEDFPKKSSLYFDIINSYLALGDIDKALTTLDKIEAKVGKNEMIGLTRVDLMSKKPNADLDSIYSYLSEYYKECKTPRLATALGDYYVRTYKDSLAMAYYDEATSIDEDFTPAYYGKAAINQMLRQYDSFFDNISHFIKDPALNPKIKAEYVTSLMENPQFIRTFADDFDQIMVDLRDTHPQDTTVNALLSGYYYNTNRSYLSAELLRQNTEMYPESFDHAFQYLVLLYYTESWEAMIEATTTFLHRFPGNCDILQLRAMAFANLGSIDNAIEDYQQILAQKPRDTTVQVVTYSSLASLYHDKGDSKNTFKYFEKALKIKPDYIVVLNNYAYYLSLEGKNLKKAKQMSQKTIEAEPNNPTYLDTYAWILHLMGQNVEAKAIFKHAMLYGGKDSAEILLHYSIVLDALGEKDLANIYRNQAKAMDMK